MFTQLPPETQERVKKEIAQDAEKFSSKPGRVQLQGITHVVVGTK